MKVIVFGATGGTGRQLVQQALEQGHEVTAFLRSPERLGLSHAKLRLVQGDVLDAAAVERVMSGHDAVLCALGAPALKTGVIRSAGTRNIVAAMETAGVRRLICQTSLGYGDSKAVLKITPFVFRFIIAPILLREGFADHARQEEHIRASRLDWVIARPGNLTDGSRTGRYRHGFAADDRTIKGEISRADVADFMLRQLTDDAYLSKTPGLSY